MRVETKWIAGAAMAVGMILASAQPAAADQWNKKTILTVNEPVEVPGAILEPGKYVLRLVDSESNRHIVRFMNEEENEVISTVIAIPNTRLEPTGETAFEWYETPTGQPPAMRAWFYPGDNFGQEFVYEERRGAQLASMTTTQTAVATPERRPAPRQTVTQVEEEETTVAQAAPQPAPRPQVERTRPAPRTEPRQEPTQIAQARPEPRPAPAPQPVMEQDELPQTAGPAPLLALLGLISVGSGMAIRKLRK